MNTLQNDRVAAAEIAAALDYTPAYFSRIVPNLIETHGMPHPLPSSRRRPRVWWRPAVERWLANYGDAARGQAGRALPAPIEAERQRLHLAYVNDNAGQAAGARA
ncbi:MAG: hypothetical protein ACK4PN_08560 [Allorhizobium sp.]